MPSAGRTAKATRVVRASAGLKWSSGTVSVTQTNALPSVHGLPPVWQAISHLNPFFYMIDGFRHGFFGVSDVSPWLSLAVVGGTFVAVAALTLRLLASGYKLRH